MLDDPEKQVLRLTERVRSLEMLVFNLRVGRRVLMRLLEEQVRRNEVSSTNAKRKPRRHIMRGMGDDGARTRVIEFPKQDG